MRLRRGAVLVCALLGALAPAAVADAQIPGLPPIEIPQVSLTQVEEFSGAAAKPRPVRAPRVPRHPFMAPNGRSNLHDDAYMSDTYRQSGPLGEGTDTRSTLFVRECASVTFDSEGRIVTICVGLDRPVLALLDPDSLAVLAAHNLPLRNLDNLNILSDFSGGGYFYLDHKDQAVLPTNTRHVLVMRHDGGTGFDVVRDFDVSGVVPRGDAILSVLPDWKGRIWFASADGVVGAIVPRSGKVRALELGERISNSFAVDEDGGVYIVSDAALYRFDWRRGKPRRTWSESYPNSGVQKPGQTSPGSGATPTLMGDRHVAITDNAEHMHVLAFRRDEDFRGRRRVCKEAVFERGAGSTDQSLIATDRKIVVENNFGYTGPLAVELGGVTTPGLQRVDLERDGRGCDTDWRSEERAPSVVPKLSLGNGLVYTYTKPERDDGADAWFLTAIDFRSGETVYRRLSGVGLGYNNNYAPVTIGPDGDAYVGVLGGLTRFSEP